MNVSEVFGHDISNHSANAWADRDAKVCPFKKSPCNKASKVDPIGICSISDGFEAASLCPNRFLQDNVVFRDAARLAFGSGCRVAVFPELRILQIPDPKRDGVFKKIGKVDFVLGNIRAGQVVDFCAVEIQAAYFSGTEIRSALQHFLKNHNFGTFDIDRRPDFRSSAQKRLVPQLQLKVPVFRRWGKSFL